MVAVTAAVPLAVCARVAMAAAAPTDLLRTLFPKQSRKVFKESFLSSKRELLSDEMAYCIMERD